MRTREMDKLDDKMMGEYRCAGACELGRHEGEMIGRMQAYYELGISKTPPPDYERSHYSRLLKHYQKEWKKLIREGK